MEKRYFPNWLSEYMKYTSKSESPDIFHLWTAVATIGGALRRQVWIDQRYFQWVPNFYVILVGPPGVAAKSTSVRAGLSLLEGVKGIHFGPQSMTWQSLTMSLEEASALIPYGDKFLPMSCITCAVSELGTFLRPDDKEFMDVLVGLWDGQLETWKRTTKTQGSDTIVNPWINVIGCTTPAWLRNNFPEAMIGGGLTSRIVFVYGDKKRQLVAYPADIIDEQEYKDHAAKLVHDLCIIAEMKGPYLLDAKAKAWGSAWYENHWSTRPDHMASERYGGYIARKQTHMHKLAMVLAAAQRNELVIIEEDLIIANQMVTGLEADMAIVFEAIGIADTSKHVNEMLAYLNAFKRMTHREIWRRMMPIMNSREFDEATQAGVKAGYIKLINDGDDLIYTPAKD